MLLAGNWNKVINYIPGRIINTWVKVERICLSFYVFEIYDLYLLATANEPYGLAIQFKIHLSMSF